MTKVFTSARSCALLLTGALLFSCTQTSDPDVIDLDALIPEADIEALQQAMEAGQVSSVELVNYYITRIQELDDRLNSILEVNPEALLIAEQLDAERRNGRVRSPLHGIPVLLKDNIDTADAMHTTAGSLALAGAPPPSRDAFLVSRLRNAGAVILGKTNLSEWANFRSSRSSSGWSGRGGQTRNPYVLDRSPCGSSSGSGVAVAANLAAVAVGTETDGSVVCPSAINGIVGIKPTLGLVSRSGIIPIAASQDTAGPMARTVADAALLLNGMTGRDPNDVVTTAATVPQDVDYSEYLQADGLMGTRIGVVRQLFGNDPALNDLLEQQLTILRQGGATLVDVEFDYMDEMGDAEFEVLLYEFKAGLNDYLQNRGGPIASLQGLIDYNNANREREMPYFGQERFEQAQQKGPLSDQAYRNALRTARALSREQGIDRLMAEQRLDAFVAPGNNAAWLIDLVHGDSPIYIGSSTLAAVSGYPSITVPAGFIKELPIGLLFFGAAFSEPKLIAIAYDYEQRSQARRQPKFLRTYR